ncbi:MAG: hypothetical protein ACYCR4_13595 [Acidimicrobiales bacterium]
MLEFRLDRSEPRLDGRLRPVETALEARLTRLVIDDEAANDPDDGACEHPQLSITHSWTNLSPSRTNERASQRCIRT